MEGHVLPDLLAPGLRLVFCGTAAGLASARAEAYYAYPGNKFWPTLQRVGLTPRRFAPAEYPRLLELGIGLTDLVKFRAGADAVLRPGDYDAPALRSKLQLFRPRLCAFTSKQAGRSFLGRVVKAYGLQPERVDHPGAEGHTALYVLPSPSGLARGAWDEGPWRELASIFHALHP